MAVLKCKMCGGDLQATDNTYGTCTYCGSKMTLPKASDEKLVNLFNRANHFRRLNEFDKALSAYEGILNEDSANAEAHWCVVLCRYGIEYVEDPKSLERIPTCHRVQFESILSAPDYLAALEHAPDAYTRTLYEEEAKKISEIQKGILAISNQEEPYDIFICYKETDSAGSRTKESAIAQEIYYALTKENYKVFFSRITLEKKLGQQYEPYIFNALNSAKVMLVVGTQKEHFEAVWVRNEWSRFLAILKNDRSRLLIPCYRDMDAYDLPDELSMLQSQDMSKIGFIQDLTHGIEKIIRKPKQSETKTVSVADNSTTSTNIVPGVEPLLKRVFMFLEDGDFKQANEYCERVLDLDPENARAYIGKLCVELKAKTEEYLSNSKSPLDDMPNYIKALRFADSNYHAVLIEYNKIILERIQEEKRIERERIAKLIQQEEKRGWAFLEKSDWKQADKCFNKALELDSKHASAYVGKLCVDLKVCSEALLIDSRQAVNNIEFPSEVISLAKNGNTVEATKLLCKSSTLNSKEANAIVKKIYKRIPITTEYSIASLTNNTNYRQALMFADVDYRIKLEGYENIIQEKIIEDKRIAEEKKQEEIYLNLINDKNEAFTKKYDSSVILGITNRFRAMNGYKDTELLAEECNIHYNRLILEEKERKREKEEQQKLDEERRVREQEELQKQYEERKRYLEEEKRRQQQEELHQREQRRQWEQQGLCRYCGGQIGGVFTKKCKSCGKAK
jgi:hypothetical protein